MTHEEKRWNYLELEATCKRLNEELNQSRLLIQELRDELIVAQKYKNVGYEDEIGQLKLSLQQVDDDNQELRAEKLALLLEIEGKDTEILRLSGILPRPKFPPQRYDHPSHKDYGKEMPE